MSLSQLAQEAARSCQNTTRSSLVALLSMKSTNDDQNRVAGVPRVQTAVHYLSDSIYMFSKHHLFSHVYALTKHHLPLFQELSEKHHVSVLSKATSHFFFLFEQKHPFITQLPEKHHMTTESLRKREIFTLGRKCDKRQN